MIPLLTREEARAIDRGAVDDLGLPTVVLMENAGRGAARLLEARFPGGLDRPVLVGGTGNNGGDAWVVARHLWNAGRRPVAILIGDPDRLRGDAALNFAAMTALGVATHRLSPGDPSLASLLAPATVVVDGMFGTGLDRRVEGGLAETLTTIDAANAPIVSLDVPSGIDSDSGAVLGVAVRAAVTVTFGGHKRGLHQHPGVDHAGDVVAVSIGVPWPGPSVPAALFEPDDAAAALPPRARDAHKGTAGHVLVVAGAAGKSGAAALSGLGALRGGAGLATVATRTSARADVAQTAPELMTEALDEGDAGGAVSSAGSLAAGMQAAVVGPGLGLDGWGTTVALELARVLPVPTVLDADALTAFAGRLDELASAAGPRVLTPHPGEASRLLGCSTAAVQADRYGAALELAARAGHVVVLKGARTVVATADGQIRVCRRGTPALGVAGTGDVLSGVVAAQLATQPDPLTAAATGVLLHALAGELAASADRGLLAGEVARAIPAAVERCRLLTA